jgi:hypothetical protein
MNMNQIIVTTAGLGKKCDGTQYTKLFQTALAGIGEVKTASEAKTKFWQGFDTASAEYHVGSAGKAKYSAPFLAAIDAAFSKGGK